MVVGARARQKAVAAPGFSQLALGGVRELIGMPALESVKASVRVIASRHSLAGTGYHVPKFRMVDPGVVLQKLIVDLGGIEASYLGPPESCHAGLDPR